ncbi:hypothetical protein OQA88_8554 [Cercophora sp. LCS_1]
MGGYIKIGGQRAHSSLRCARWRVTDLLGFTMFLTAILAVVHLVRPQYQPRASPNRFGPLKFTPSGTFQISIFSDLHFGENAWTSWGPQQDLNSVKVIESILSSEPDIDLVVLNGDLITGENTYLSNASHYTDQIVAPLVDRNLTWASTYGNHDSSYNLSRAGILAREQRYANARTKSMVDGDVGVSNYYFPVYGADCDDGDICAPELLLWFFDSRGGFKFRERDKEGKRVGLPDWVDGKVVDWWKSTNEGIVNDTGRVVPSLAFVHIPTNASRAFQDEGVDPNKQPGIDADVPVAMQGQGWCEDGVDDGTCDYGGQDVPFMEAVAGMKGLMAVFSGHDHGNTWCVRWDRAFSGMDVKGSGVNLCFGQHSGYGGYGTWIRGARQVVVSKDMLGDGAVDTYIRLESGKIVGEITLNSTYGIDEYPATPDDRTFCPTCKH